MDSQCDFQITFDFSTSTPIVVVPSTAQLSSDGGLLPIRQFDEQIGMTEEIAGALTDRRHQGYIDHTFLDMTRMRVYGILADYADFAMPGLACGFTCVVIPDLRFRNVIRCVNGSTWNTPSDSG